MMSACLVFMSLVSFVVDELPKAAERRVVQAEPAERKPEEPGPEGPPPRVAKVRVTKGGFLESAVIQMVPVTRTITTKQTVIKDGKTVVQEVNVPVTAYETRTIMAQQSLDGVHATDSDGKKLDKKALGEKLATLTPVVISSNGQPVDPLYLNMFRKGTIVLVLPAPKGLTPVAPPVPVPLPATVPAPAPVPAAKTETPTPKP